MNSIDLGERLVRKAEKVLSSDGITNATADDDTIPTTKTVKDYVDNQEHGNIHSDGSIGSTSGLPIKTGSGGVLETGTFGTTAGTFAEGNHTHGNVNNNGSIGSTSGLPIKTGSSGVLETGTFGTTAGTFSEGNHTHTVEQIAPLVTNKADKDNGASQITDDNYTQYSNLEDSSNGVVTNLPSNNNDVTQAMINSAINYSIGYLRDENNNRSGEINNIEGQLIGQSLYDMLPDDSNSIFDLNVIILNGLYYGNESVYSRTINKPDCTLTNCKGYYLNVYSNENDDSLVQTITYIGTDTEEQYVSTNGSNTVNTTNKLKEEVFSRVFHPNTNNVDLLRSAWKRVIVNNGWRTVYNYVSGDDHIYININESLRLTEFGYYVNEKVDNAKKTYNLNATLKHYLWTYSHRDEVIPCRNPFMSMMWNYDANEENCSLHLWSREAINKYSSGWTVQARTMWRY